VLKPTPNPILKTPEKKSRAPQASEATTVRHNGKLAVKTQAKGRRTSEEMAQEILCRKLEGAPDQLNKNDPVRDRLTKLFDEPIP
jgi:hypothetical protein